MSLLDNGFLSILLFFQLLSKGLVGSVTDLVGGRS